MINTIYDIEISEETLKENLRRICNQIFKLLPMREEGKDYIKPLDTLIIEIMGLASLVPGQPKWLALVCKLQGLKEGADNIDFFLFRRTIFEACGLVDELLRKL